MKYRLRITSENEDGSESTYIDFEIEPLSISDEPPLIQFAKELLEEVLES